jgi:DNA mismatch repair protein MutS
MNRTKVREIETTTTTTLIDEYFNIYTKSLREYGEKTCVFIAVGSFYEVYSVSNDRETIGNAERVSEIIRCDFTNKNKLKRATEGCSTRACPDFCGFGTAYLGKYLPPLLNENYTVVIVDQLENANERAKGKLVKRGVVAVHSPTLKSPEFETVGDSDYQLVHVLVESVGNGSFIYSICSVNNVTNQIELYENYTSTKVVDEINRVLLRYSPKELLIHTINIPSEIEFDLKSSPIETNGDVYKEYTKMSVQNEYLKTIYKHVDFGLLTPIEYFNLYHKQLSVLNLMYTFDFMGRHDLRYLQNLCTPRIIEDNEHLVLANYTLKQLNITETINIIDFTSTAIGKRYLKSVMVKPFKSSDTIESRYHLTESLRPFGYADLEKLLNGLLDFERYHRKMSLEALSPSEFEKLDGCYSRILDISHYLIKHGLFGDVIPNLDRLNKYREDYLSQLDISLLKGPEQIHFFKKGIVPELDEIESKIVVISHSIEQKRLYYENVFKSKVTGTGTTGTGGETVIKLDSTDTEGYFFTCTRLRFEKLKGLLTKEAMDEIKMKTTSSGNTIKFFTEPLSRMSFELVNYTQLLNKKINMQFCNLMKRYSGMYHTLFTELKQFIEIVDITKSNLKCAIKLNYTRPKVSDGTSFLNFKDIRHPIIERIATTEYVTNDLVLDNKNLGVVLYGLNSCGKSSLLRAIGINLVMAQAGLYVACREFVYAPFSTLISQVDLTDNLFNGKSSFINEMIGLRKILSCCSEDTLVLSDELCKGTEEFSAQAIVTSTILRMVKNNTKFFFTSHLHGIASIDSIKNESKVKIFHLSVSFKESLIIFERKLKPGPGISTYGLEVCKSVISDDDFIDTAFKIRNTITNTSTEVLPLKKSQYNKKKILNCCEICGGKRALETHHIHFQSNCDSNGFVNEKSFHKNETYNLACLCKGCHDQITHGKIICTGYTMTTKGRILEYHNAF